jgi:hypothetical protein
MTDAPGGTDAPDGGVPTPDEQRLLDALRRAVPDEQPPPGFISRAEQLLTYLDLERDLAELLEQPAEPVGMRGGDSGAALAFGTADGSVAIDVTVDRATVTAQVLAGAVVSVGLETRTGVVAVTSPDPLGRFAFHDVAPGPTRLSLRRTTTAVVTDWFLV